MKISIELFVFIQLNRAKVGPWSVYLTGTVLITMRVLSDVEFQGGSTHSIGCPKQLLE